MKKRLIAVLLLANIAVFGNWLLTQGSRSEEMAALADREFSAALLNHPLAQVQLDSQDGRAVVGFFNDVAPTCPSGKILDLLNRAAARHGRIPFLAVVPRDFSESDAKNLEVNWGLEFPVRRADPDLHRAWSAVADRYGEAAVNAMVVFWDGPEMSVVRGTGKLKAELERLADAD